MTVSSRVGFKNIYPRSKTAIQVQVTITLNNSSIMVSINEGVQIIPLSTLTKGFQTILILPSPFCIEKNRVSNKNRHNYMCLRLVTLFIFSFMASWMTGSFSPVWSWFQVLNASINHNFTPSLACLLYSTGHIQKNKLDLSFHSHQSENCVRNITSPINSMSRPALFLFAVLYFIFPLVL